MNRSLKFSIWFSIVIAVVFVVAWLWLREYSNPGPYDMEPVNIFRNGNGAVPALSEVEGWQTYRNEKYGFEIKYPRNWEVNENSAKNGIAFNSQERISYVESSGTLVNVIWLTLHRVPHASVTDFRDFIKKFDAGFYQNFQVGRYTVKDRAVEHFKSKDSNFQTVFIDFNRNMSLE